MALNSGLETFEAMGHTAAAQVYDCNLMRIDVMQWAQRSAMVIGDIQTNETDPTTVVFGAFKFPTDVYLQSVEFNAHAGPPTGRDALLQINVAGSPLGIATLTAAAEYKLSTIIRTVNIATVDTARDKVTTTAPHGFANGTAATLENINNQLPGSLDVNTTYYLSSLEPNSFQFHLTYEDAIAHRAPVDLTSEGTGTTTVHGIVTPLVKAGDLVELLFTQSGSNAPGAWINVTINVQKHCTTP